MTIQPEQSGNANGGFPVADLVAFHNAWVESYNANLANLSGALEESPERATSNPALFDRGRIVRDGERLGAFRRLLESFGTDTTLLEAMLHQEERQEE